MGTSKSTAHIQEKYDTLVSKHYNEENEKFDVQKQARIQLLSQLKQFQNTVKNPNKILDLATGTGELLDDLNRVYPQSEIWGLDLSSKMIEKAKQLNAQFPHIRFINDDALHIDQHFNQELDLVIIQFLLSYVDCNKLMEKLNRVIVPNGLLSITSTTLESYPEIFNVTKSIYKKIFLKDLDQKAISKVTYLPKNGNELCEILEKNSYKIIDHQLLKTEITLDDYAEFQYFGTSRGWFLQAFDHINPALNFILKMLSKKYFPLTTRINASMILAQKIN